MPAAFTSSYESTEKWKLGNMQQKGQCQINQTVEVQHEKKPTSNLKSMPSVGFEKTTKFIEIFIP